MSARTFGVAALLVTASSGTASAAVAPDETIVRSGTSKSTMKVSGRIHADYWRIADTDGSIDAFEGEDPQDRFGFRRVRFGVKGDINESMAYKIEMEFAGGNDVEFRDVTFGWKKLPVLRKLQIGNQKRPYGLDHLNSSRYNVFLERPFIIEAFNQDARRFGAVSYGVSDRQRFNWRYGVYNQRLIQDEGNYINDHPQLEVAGRFAHTVGYDEENGGRNYAHWAVAGTVANPDGMAGSANEARFRTRPEARTASRWLNTDPIAGADEFCIIAVEGVINRGRFQAVGEYQTMFLDREAAFGNDLRFDGGYVYVAVFVTDDFMAWDRKDGTLGRIKPRKPLLGKGKGLGALQIALRYSMADLTDEDVFGGDGESVGLAVNWYWNANARIQLNYLQGEITDRFATLDEGEYDIFGVRAMVDF